MRRTPAAAAGRRGSHGGALGEEATDPGAVSWMVDGEREGEREGAPGPPSARREGGGRPAPGGAMAAASSRLAWI